MSSATIAGSNLTPAPNGTDVKVDALIVDAALAAWAMWQVIARQV
jgi:hypothetical protein